MRNRQMNVLIFWLGLVALILWDLNRSSKIDLRFEPPLIAAGSGKATSGAHCANVGK